MREEALFLPYEAPVLRDDDHPLFEELCDAARRGDLEKVKKLVETDEVPVNRRDKWDSTPLYYTALCGHIEVTKYLLKAGAHCDPHTFEGERCLYGALNDQIRNLLRSHRVTKAVDSSADYALFTYGLYVDPREHQADLTFALPNAAAHNPLTSFPLTNGAIPHFEAHRSILAARIPFLAHELATRWRHTRGVIQIKNKRVHAATLRAVLLWAYTGQLARDLPDILIDDCLFLCRQWKIHELHSMIVADQENAKMLTGSAVSTMLAKRRVVLMRDVKGLQRDVGVLWRAVTQVGGPWLKTEDGGLNRDHDFTLERLINGMERLQVGEEGNSVDTSTLSQQPDLDPLHYSKPMDDDSILMTLLTASRPDVIIDITGTHFPCHMAFLTRSEYFKALLLGGFMENQSNVPDEQQRKVVTLSAITDPQVFRTVLEFLYIDTTTTLSPTLSLPVLHAADLLLLDRLKSQTVTYILNTPLSVYLSLPADSNTTVPDLLRAAWHMNLPRLEQHLTRHYAEMFDTYCNGSEIRQLIKESSESVRNRQETDTIIFVDDLRWWIAKGCGFEGGVDVGVSAPIVSVQDTEQKVKGKTIETSLSGGFSSAVGERYEERLADLQRKMGVLDGILEELGVAGFVDEGDYADEEESWEDVGRLS